VRGMELKMLPPEELIWAKLYVLQRDRCDWGDLLNILFMRGERLNWSHLLGRVNEDRRMVAALVEIFAWMCPGRAAKFPAGLWEELAIQRPVAEAAEVEREHVRALDSRDWFGPNDQTETRSHEGPANTKDHEDAKRDG
jgi:hypothetical protein